MVVYSDPVLIPLPYRDTHHLIWTNGLTSMASRPIRATTSKTKDLSILQRSRNYPLGTQQRVSHQTGHGRCIYGRVVRRYRSSAGMSMDRTMLLGGRHLIERLPKHKVLRQWLMIMFSMEGMAQELRTYTQNCGTSRLYGPSKAMDSH